MSDGDVTTLLLSLMWMAWSAARIAGASKRSADALGVLRNLAERRRP